MSASTNVSPSRVKERNWVEFIQKQSKNSDMNCVASMLPSVKLNSLQLPSPSLNWALGGGLNRRKIIIYWGPESSGKTFLAYMTVLSEQMACRARGEELSWTVWYDAELTGFDAEYASQLGIDTNRVWVLKGNSFDGIFDHFSTEVVKMMEEGFPCKIVVIDSLKSIIGPKEANLESVGDHMMGDLSQLLPKGIKRMLNHIYKHQMIGVFVQQVSMEMDQQKQKQGHRYHFPGGKGVVHHADYIVLTERVDSKASRLFEEEYKMIGDLPLQVGHTVRCKIQKNRSGAPARVAEFRIRYGKGISDVGLEVVKLGLGLGVIHRPNQQTYQIGDLTVRGIDKLVAEVERDPALRDEIMKRVYAFEPTRTNATADDIAESAEFADEGSAGAA